MSTMEKFYRVADHALVVYHERLIVAVKHADGGAWLTWNLEGQTWDKAEPIKAKTLDKLPLAGHVTS